MVGLFKHVFQPGYPDCGQLLNKFQLSFDLLLSREAGLWKPSGAPFLFVLQNLGMKNWECCVIGDSHFDVKAAEEAGLDSVCGRQRDELMVGTEEWLCGAKQKNRRIFELRG